MASKTTFPVSSEESSMMRNKESGSVRGKRDVKQKLSKLLGDTAREARHQAGLTQADVAERIGVATEVYGRLERGLLLPSVPTLRKLCLALRLPADKLLSLSSAQPPAWTETPAPERDAPQLRRLLRHARKLSTVQLRALAMVAATLRKD